MKDFYDFGSKLSSSNVLACPVGLEDDENGDSGHYNLIKGNFKGINFPVVFKQEDGKKLTDILDTGFAGFYLISDRMKVILKENNLTGWETFPIKLFDKKENEIPGYNGFAIIGRSGSTSYEKSEIIERRKVPTGPICKFYKGVFVNNWDKTDFFSPEGTYETFVTKSAANILIKEKITNLRLINLAELEIDVRNVLN